jgi:hypothetical protein
MDRFRLGERGLYKKWHCGIENGSCNGGVDINLFNPTIPPRGKLADLGGFKFVHVGKFEPRKGSKMLIQTFDESFSSDKELATYSDRSDIYFGTSLNP